MLFVCRQAPGLVGDIDDAQGFSQGCKHLHQGVKARRACACFHTCDDGLTDAGHALELRLADAALLACFGDFRDEASLLCVGDVDGLTLFEEILAGDVDFVVPAYGVPCRGDLCVFECRGFFDLGEFRTAEVLLAVEQTRLSTLEPNDEFGPLQGVNRCDAFDH